MRWFRSLSLLLVGGVLAARAQAPAAARRIRSHEVAAAAGPLFTFPIIEDYSLNGTAPELHHVTVVDDGASFPAASCQSLASLAPPVPLEPREYSNRTLRGDSPAILLALDLPTVAERGLTWIEVADVIQRLGPSHHVYLYMLGADGTIYPAHEFPRPSDPPASDDRRWVAGVPALLDDALHDSRRARPSESQDVDDRVRPSLIALQDLVSYLAVESGPKALVWVSHAVPLGGKAKDGMWHDYTNFIRRFAADLARSGIVVYTVDERDRGSEGLASLDILRQLAGLTSGQWLLGDATAEAVRTAAREADFTYRVGYAPPSDRWDDRFHKLQVTALIRGNLLTMRSPEGYLGDPRKVDPAKHASLAALGPSDDPGIGLRAAVTPGVQRKDWKRFQVRVDPADLHLTDADTTTGEIHLSIAHFDNGWKAVRGARIDSLIHIAADRRTEVMREGVSITFEQPVPPSVRKVRVVVSDVNSWAIGSLTVPMSTPSGK